MKLINCEEKIEKLTERGEKLKIEAVGILLWIKLKLTLNRPKPHLATYYSISQNARVNRLFRDIAWHTPPRLRRSGRTRRCPEEPADPGTEKIIFGWRILIMWLYLHIYYWNLDALGCENKSTSIGLCSILALIY